MTPFSFIYTRINISFLCHSIQYNELLIVSVSTPLAFQDAGTEHHFINNEDDPVTELEEFKRIQINRNCW